MLVDSKLIWEKCTSIKQHEKCIWHKFQRWHHTKDVYDTLVLCKDGINVKANKLVLAATSGYFYAALTGPLSKISDNGLCSTSIPYSSSSFELFLDCFYQKKPNMDGVDIIEYVSMCDYFNVSHMSTEGLRLASLQLNSENCFNELNKATSNEMLYPRWIDVIVHYIINDFCSNGLQYDEIRFEELSRESLVSIIMSPATVVCLPQLKISILSKFFQLSERDELAHTLVSRIHLYACELTSLPLINKNDLLKKICARVEEYRQQHFPKCIPDAKEILFSKSENEIAVKLKAKLRLYTKVGFTLFVEDMKILTDRLDASCLSSSLTSIKVNSKFFSWKNSLYALAHEQWRFTLWMYNWRESVWVSLAKADLPKSSWSTPPDFENFINCDYDITLFSCLVMDTQVLISAILKVTPFKSSALISIDFTHCPPIINVTFHKHYLLRKIVLVASEVIYFETPSLLIKGPDLRLEESVTTTVKHGKVNFNFGCVVSFHRETFHIYSLEDEEGIFIDRFNAEMLKWDEQLCKLCKKHTLKDAFVVNNKLFVAFKKRENYNDHENNKFVFIGQCSYEEVQFNQYEIKLLESGILKIDSKDYGFCGDFVIVRKNIFMFEDISTDMRT